MSIEFVTMIDDYEYANIPRRLMEEVKDRLTCSLCKETVDSYPSKYRKIKPIEGQHWWSLA